MPSNPRLTRPTCRRALGALALCLPLGAGAALELDDVAHEGELRYLAQRPDPGAYHYASRVTIGPQSLETGLVHLATCHHQLDPNHRIVIAFNPQRVQDLRITVAEGVGRAEVRGHRVELADVQRGARVCIDLHSRVLEPQGEGRWRLHAGPLMRRYLDGYLPMQARLSFEWPEGLLRLRESHPAPQPGVHREAGPTGGWLDLTFAGRMTATLELERGSR